MRTASSRPDAAQYRFYKAARRFSFGDKSRIGDLFSDLCRTTEMSVVKLSYIAGQPAGETLLFQGYVDSFIHCRCVGSAPCQTTGPRTDFTLH